MGSKSDIEWTDASWNPVTGCTKVSPGCDHCYAERLSKRLKAMGQRNYQNGFEVTLQEHMLETPLEWKRPRCVFVNSMSDLFHADVPDEFIAKAFDTMKQANWHIFQVLTKRSERLAKLSSSIEWPDNVWMGVSVENADYMFRLDHLRMTNAHVRFVSFEPLLGPVGKLPADGLDWVIAGGESGPGSRPMKEEWVLDIRDQCASAHLPFFFKQWGGTNKKKAGRLLEGQIWDEMPEFPLNV